MKSRLRRSAELCSAVMMALSLTIISPLAASASGTPESDRQQHFRDAAREFNVPEEVLLGLSYNQSRWEDHDGLPSASGGYGLMHLNDSFTREDGRGDPTRPVAKSREGKKSFTIDEASRLINVPASKIRKDERQNIRGAAALMATYAKQDNKGKTPKSIDAWYGTVARSSGFTEQQKAEDFADDVYATINSGTSATTKDGDRMSLKATRVKPDKASLKSKWMKTKRNATTSDTQTECPPTITCTFVPARHAQNNPDDPKDYGNLDPANRPKDMKIKYIVIHDTEGTYQSSIDWFQDPTSFVSAHYVIRSSDGAVTQMVKNKDVAWHAGNWYMNMHSIGVEHEGYAADGAAWYTEAMYRSSAKLVRHLAKKYDIPLDREHIVGHEQFHGLTPARATAMHNDPGPFWDWDYYMSLLQGKPIEQSRHNGNAITIAPKFSRNQQVVQNCDEAGCADLPKQATNFVYLRTAPSMSAPLLTDAGLHPDDAAGTKEIDDWSAVATYGQRFALAGRHGDWTAVWFGGQRGWFYNPESSRTAVASQARLVTPKAGKTSIPLYGRPVPEAAAYANGVPPLAPVPLQYKLLAGQSYVAYDSKATNDYFHVLTFDGSTPGEGEVVVGNERYIPISYNHRQAFVKASDVLVIE